MSVNDGGVEGVATIDTIKICSGPSPRRDCLTSRRHIWGAVEGMPKQTEELN